MCVLPFGLSPILEPGLLLQALGLRPGHAPSLVARGWCHLFAAQHHQALQDAAAALHAASLASAVRAKVRAPPSPLNCGAAFFFQNNPTRPANAAVCEAMVVPPTSGSAPPLVQAAHGCASASLPVASFSYSRT